MKIVLVTPLFPPDIGGGAPYVKELAKQLVLQNHEITVLTYGCLPEDVSGVSFVCVNKKYPLPIRLFLYTLALLRVARKNDVIYAQNGPSTELPIWLIKIFLKTPLIIHIGDKAAHEHAQKHMFKKSIERFVFRHARKIITDSPQKRPEILPFKPYPEKAFSEYNTSWESHVEMLNNLFKHVKK